VLDKVDSVLKHEDDKCKIEYFVGSCKEENDILLDSEEHQNWLWISPSQFDKVDMIMNLKGNLEKIVKKVGDKYIPVLEKDGVEGDIKEWNGGKFQKQVNGEWKRIK